MTAKIQGLSTRGPPCCYASNCPSAWNVLS